MLNCYMTHTTDGLSVNPQGIMGGRLVVWNPVLLQEVDVHIPPAGGAWAKNVFAGITIGGVPNQTPADRKPYYVFMMLDEDEAPDYFLQPAGLPVRYGPNADGVYMFTDPAGNIGTLIGMVCPVDGSIGNVLGAGARALCSSSPFLHTPQQRLTANAGQIGVSFSNTSAVELPEFDIISCAWAWVEANSKFMGRVADNDGMPNVFLRSFAVSLVDGTKHYGPTIIVQFDRAGQNLPIGGHGVSRAFDDGAYRFGIEGWVSHGACHLNVEHAVNAHL